MNAKRTLTINKELAKKPGVGVNSGAVVSHVELNNISVNSDAI